MSEEKAVVEYRARDGQQMKLTPEIIKKYLIRGYPDMVTNQELYFFMGICKSRGLNPFINDCYPIKYTKDPMAIITSIDYYRKRARAQVDCRGWKKGIVILGEDGKLNYREGCILLDGEKLIGGWAEAKPEKVDIPFRVEVNLKRYIKRTKEGAITRFWSEENQPEQIAKVAESQCLRTAWPDEFQGLYTDAEAQSRDAQEEFNAAVSTATPAETQSPDFATVFSAELTDPIFPAYLKAACETYKLSEDDARSEFVKQPEQIKRLFAEWKKRSPAIDPQKEKAANAAAVKSGMKTESDILNEEASPSFRDEWINLKGPGYSTAVFKNLDRFKALEGDLLAEAVAKWQKLYPEAPCPFAPANPPETVKQPTPEPQGNAQPPEASGMPPDFEEKELARLRAEIAQYDRVDHATGTKARHELGMGLTYTPANIDGCRVLLERIGEILKARPAANGR